MSNEQILRLYIDHRRKLVEYAGGIVRDPGRAEDVVQEAFLRFRAAASGRLLKEPVGYLYRIVRNLALDRLRRTVLEGRYWGKLATTAASSAIRASRSTSSASRSSTSGWSQVQCS